MADQQHNLTKLGFIRTFIVPTLLVFLVPVLGWAFFQHAQARYNAQARDAILRKIASDSSLSPEQRSNATAFFSQVPVSRMMRHPELAAQFDSDVRFDYATFRWMIFISALSILLGICVFMLLAVLVLLSFLSQRAQYLSLWCGWNVMRLFGASQAIAQGILLVALSYWVTALWFEFYSVKLIVVTGLLALGCVVAVLLAIFRVPRNDFVVEGHVLPRDSSARLWDELRTICDKVRTEPPDQVIAGIDDNFFVTEQPVVVNGTTHRGRSLFVSLALLKQLQGSEADAVLAHEMAHFSGRDTAYSKKISPLLNRYDHYLHALYEGGVTLPLFHFMACFRALYQLSLGTLSRQREFRADKIAADVTSPADLASALLRIAAYSKYRHSVEQGLFAREHVLTQANIAEQIERGFPNYALSFAENEEVGNLATGHPFDSHPPLAQRLEALHVPLTMESARTLLSQSGDGRWYDNIQQAAALERRQWDEYEERFRTVHEAMLPYRYLPANEEERACVLKSFPDQSIEGKDGSLVIDFEKIGFAKWPEPVLFQDVTSITLVDAILSVAYERAGAEKGARKVDMKKFGAVQQRMIVDILNRYYGRHTAAAAYQQAKLEAPRDHQEGRDEDAAE